MHFGESCSWTRKKIFAKEITFEDLLQKLFFEYDLIMNVNQYVLIGSTVRSYLSYLHEEGRVSFEFKENKMFWKKNV